VGRLGPQQAGTRPTWAANRPAHPSRITPPGSRSAVDPLQLSQSSIYLLNFQISPQASIYLRSQNN
jgi:hypothetical protein